MPGEFEGLFPEDLKKMGVEPEQMKSPQEAEATAALEKDAGDLQEPPKDKIPPQEGKRPKAWRK